MSKPLEILYTSELGGQLWNIAVWDPYTGTSVTNFKSGTSSRGTLCFVRGDFVLSATNNKPIINAWNINRRDQPHMRTVTPGRVTALSVSPDSTYCVAAIGAKLYVWQLSTGNLMVILNKHYQTVNCVRFTDDSNFFITGADDNIIYVWSLTDTLGDALFVGGSGGGSVEPMVTFMKHSLPVTDIWVGFCGIKARVVSASLDQTVKLWEMRSGQLLANFLFEYAIRTVRMDLAEYRLFAGTSAGYIFQVNLFEKCQSSECHIYDTDERGEKIPAYRGHTKAVTCLSLTMDGCLLVSGSDDCNVKIWDTPSKQCLRTIPHKGPVTNCLLSLSTYDMWHSSGYCELPFVQFKRHLHGSQEEYSSTENVVKVRLTNKLGPSLVPEVGADFLGHSDDGEQQIDRSEHEKIETLENEVKRLSQVNKDLYDFAAKQIIDKSYD